MLQKNVNVGVLKLREFNTFYNKFKLVSYFVRTEKKKHQKRHPLLYVIINKKGICFSRYTLNDIPLLLLLHICINFQIFVYFFYLSEIRISIRNSSNYNNNNIKFNCLHNSIISYGITVLIQGCNNPRKYEIL